MVHNCCYKKAETSNSFGSYLFTFSASFEPDFGYDEIYNKTIINAGKQNVEKTLKVEILQELNGNDKDIDLYLVLSNESDEIYIERVEIIIYPSGLSLDPHFMEDYISERLDCSCVVIYSFFN